MRKAEKENHFLYNKNLKDNARGLRHAMTKAEACLWKYALRATQMKGYSFSRQRPVLNYIVDFVCKELKLVIEVDGYSHLLEEVIEKDRVRQQKIEEAGFTVIRFKDDEILRSINTVRQIIWDTIERIEAQ